MNEKTKEIMNGLQRKPQNVHVSVVEDDVADGVADLSLADIEGDFAPYEDVIVDIRGHQRKVRIAYTSGDALAEIFQQEADAGNLSPLERQLAEMKDATPEKVRAVSTKAVEGMSLDEQLQIQQRDKVYTRHILLNFILMRKLPVTPLIVDTDTDTLRVDGQIPLNSLVQDVKDVLIEAYYQVNS